MNNFHIQASVLLSLLVGVTWLSGCQSQQQPQYQTAHLPPLQSHVWQAVPLQSLPQAEFNQAVTQVQDECHQEVLSTPVPTENCTETPRQECAGLINQILTHCLMQRRKAHCKKQEVGFDKRFRNQVYEKCLTAHGWQQLEQAKNAANSTGGLFELSARDQQYNYYIKLDSIRHSQQDYQAIVRMDPLTNKNHPYQGVYHFDTQTNTLSIDDRQAMPIADKSIGKQLQLRVEQLARKQQQTAATTGDVLHDSPE